MAIGDVLLMLLPDPSVVDASKGARQDPLTAFTLISDCVPNAAVLLPIPSIADAAKDALATCLAACIDNLLWLHMC